MADQHRIEEIAEANFDLLSSSDELNQVYLEDEITEEELQTVQQVISEAEGENVPQNEDSADDFEEGSTHSRHATANSEKLDFYADANHRDSTKKQTKWAVNLFTGKYILFSETFSLNHKKSSVADDKFTPLDGMVAPSLFSVLHAQFQNNLKPFFFQTGSSLDARTPILKHSQIPSYLKS